RAEGLLGGGEGSPELRQRTGQWRADLTMVVCLEEIRLARSAIVDGRMDYTGAHLAYVKAFREYGIDVEALTPEAAAQRIRARKVWLQLALAVDDWSYIRTQLQPLNRSKQLALVAVARAADPDPTRNRLRNFAGRRVTLAEARKELEQLVAAREIETWSPPTVGLLAAVLREALMPQEAEKVLRHAQVQHPGDFWINLELAVLLRPKDRASFYRAALAVRPHSHVVRVQLGAALYYQEKLDEAEVLWRKAISLQSDPVVHFNLGLLLNRQNRFAEAEAEFRRAIFLKGNWAKPQRELGLTLFRQDRFPEAEAEFRKAIDLKKDWEVPYLDLGNALHRQNRFTEAAAEYRKAIRLKPDYADGHRNLGAALGQQGKYSEAEAAFREAIRLKPDDAGAHAGLGGSLSLQKKWEEAITVYKDAIRLKPDDANCHINLGCALQNHNRWQEAIAAYEQAVWLKPAHAKAQANLAQALAICPEGKYRDPRRAVEAAKKALALGPESSWKWQIVGWAQYRAGDWKASIVALEQSMALQTNPKGGGPWQWFFLAMAHWQLGNKDEARTWYDRAARWMGGHASTNEEWRRFRAEAAALLKIEDRPKTKSESN
ncbi:MAG: tetratricopeptide repeat protein, partial [Gemmataceae bacterium]|nr:tetratricopeptide repeat protein [Gemmataceae bacterium]